ncbi:hypothetical protein SK128_002391, partial [Halocaridina rubra]
KVYRKRGSTSFSLSLPSLPMVPLERLRNPNPSHYVPIEKKTAPSPPPPKAGVFPPGVDRSSSHPNPLSIAIYVY